VVVIRQGCWKSFIAETSQRDLPKTKVPEKAFFPNGDDCPRNLYDPLDKALEVSLPNHRGLGPSFRIHK
jgi:hypothetical protein